MDFITVDSKISIEGTTIKQKRLTNNSTRSYLVSAFFFLWFISVFDDKIARAQDKGSIMSWVSVGFFGLIIFLYILLLCDILFRRYWRNKINIEHIAKIKTAPSDEGLETHVVVTLKSKRYKLFKFRTLEKQHDLFIQKVQSINPNIQLVMD